MRRRYNTANCLELLIPTHFRAEKRCCLDYADYVAACESVLPILQQFQRTDQQAGIIGAFIDALIRAVLPDEVTARSDFHFSPERQALHYGISGMQDVALVEESSQTYVRLTQKGREHLQDPLPVWSGICAVNLEEDHAAVLRALNRLSIMRTDAGAFVLQEVDHTQLLSELQWSDDDFFRAYNAVHELDRIGLLWQLGAMGKRIDARSNYVGAVWDLRRGETIEAKFLDKLSTEWETTSVEFKSELHLEKENEKAEFVKDVLGLATTQASGRRWFIIGFNDKTRLPTLPPGADITQNRIEQILSVYTKPQVQVRYEVVVYRGHQVGKLEVFRNPLHLPYRVAKAVGGSKHIDEEDMFVRHGSQTEHPTPSELQAILGEADRMRPQ